MFASEKARVEGFSCKAPDYRQPCPACSPTRRKKKDPCCHVTVERDRVQACCHHCGKGWVFSDDDERRQARQGGVRAHATDRPASSRRWW